LDVSRRGSIVEYKLVEAKDDALKLQKEVNKHIEEGWEPLGGVSVCGGGMVEHWWFYQAMVKGLKSKSSSK
jgi:hypothetical protein